MVFDPESEFVFDFSDSFFLSYLWRKKINWTNKIVGTLRLQVVMIYSPFIAQIWWTGSEVAQMESRVRGGRTERFGEQQWERGGERTHPHHGCKRFRLIHFKVAQVSPRAKSDDGKSGTFSQLWFNARLTAYMTWWRGRVLEGCHNFGGCCQIGSLLLFFRCFWALH